MANENDGPCLGIHELSVGVEMVDKADGFIINAVGGETAWRQEPLRIILVNQASCLVGGVREEISHPQNASLGIGPCLQAVFPETVNEDKTIACQVRETVSSIAKGGVTYSTKKDVEAEGESSASSTAMRPMMALELQSEAFSEVGERRDSLVSQRAHRANCSQAKNRDSKNRDRASTQRLKQGG